MMLPEVEPWAPNFPPPRIAVAGWGALGKVIVGRLLQDPRYRLTAVATDRVGDVQAYLTAQGSTARVCRMEEIDRLADVVVECLSPGKFDTLAAALQGSRKTVIVLSAAAMIKNQAFLSDASAGGLRVVVASGAIMGLDAVRAMRIDGITSCLIVNRKPPAGLAGAPYLLTQYIDLSAITAPTCVFSGSARQAAAGFPKNVNVAIALSLAAGGPDHTRCEIWADPGAIGNVHTITVKSTTAELSMTMTGKPDPANPRSSTLAAYSVLAALDSLYQPIRIGS